MLVGGPLFVLAGFAAAFTTPGALLVFTGLGMLVCGFLLMTRLPALVATVVGVVAAVALTAQMARDLS